MRYGVDYVKEIEETIFAYGHINVQALHRSTIEITKMDQLTEKGDCVIAVSANKSAQDLSPCFKHALQNDNAKLSMLVEAGGASDAVEARGSPNLVLGHLNDLVVRKSNYVCNRTLAICADKAAIDLTRDLVEELQKPGQKVKITIRVENR
jgi:hypothetical protein